MQRCNNATRISELSLAHNGSVYYRKQPLTPNKYPNSVGQNTSAESAESTESLGINNIVERTTGLHRPIGAIMMPPERVEWGGGGGSSSENAAVLGIATSPSTFTYITVQRAPSSACSETGSIIPRLNLTPPGRDNFSEPSTNQS